MSNQGKPIKTCFFESSHSVFRILPFCLLPFLLWSVNSVLRTSALLDKHNNFLLISLILLLFSSVKEVDDRGKWRGVIPRYETLLECCRILHPTTNATHPHSTLSLCPFPSFLSLFALSDGDEASLKVAP